MQTLFLASDPPSAADWMTAIGTVGTAVLALVSVGVTILLAYRDRKQTQATFNIERADAAQRLQDERDRHRQDVERAERQLAEERERTAQELVRQHHLQLLSQLVECLAEYGDGNPSPHWMVSQQRLRILLQMLPDGTATLLKHWFQVEMGTEDRNRLGEIGQAHGGSIAQQPPRDWVYEELARNARELASGVTRA